MPLNNNAYDYSLFEERATKKGTNQRQQIQKRPQSKAYLAALEKDKCMKVFAVSFVALILIAALITVKAQYNTMNVTYNEKLKELQTLKTISANYEIKENASLNTQRIEEYATDVLGMQPVQPSQIEYITLAQEDRFIESENDEKGILDKIGDFFSGLK